MLGLKLRIGLWLELYLGVIFALSVHEMGRNLSQNMFRINFLKRNIRKKIQDIRVCI